MMEEMKNKQTESGQAPDEEKATEEVSPEEKPENKKSVLRVIGGTVYTFISALVMALAIVLVVAVIWLFKTWPHLDIYELVYTTHTPLDGTNPDMIRGFILPYGVIMVLLVIGMVVALVILRNKAVFNKVRLFCLLGGLALLVGVFFYADHRLGLLKYLRNMHVESDYIEANHIKPEKVKLTFPEKKRNLIYIFLESVEMTYSDEAHGGQFPQNVIPGLTELASEGECFSGDKNKLNGGISMIGTTWTAGAMLAQTSGLPMMNGLEQNILGTQDEFYPSLVNIGDILDQEGYNNVLMVGSVSTFGGTDTYFKSHGNYAIHDYSYAVKQGWIPSGYWKWWGYEDSKMFDFAKTELTELAAKGEPFNYTMFTMDTHFEDGYVCDECESTFGDNQYANVIHCSDKQVTSFIRWVQEQDFYENTTIVITGDHPTMDSDFCNEVPLTFQRRVFTVFLNAAAERKDDPASERTFTTMDYFPTTLAALGVEIEGDRLGLGTNLFSGKKTLIEEEGKLQLNEYIAQSVKYMNSLNRLRMTPKLKTKLNEKTTVNIRRTDEDRILFRVDWPYIAEPEYIGQVKLIVCPDDDPKNQKEYLMEYKDEYEAYNLYAAEVPAEELKQTEGMKDPHVEIHIIMGDVDFTVRSLTFAEIEEAL